MPTLQIPTITINGVDRSAWVRLSELVVNDSRSETPSTCSFTIYRPTGWIPREGQSVTVTLNTRVYFSGLISSIQINRGPKTEQYQVDYAVSCTDYSYLADQDLIYGSWTSVSANTIIAAILPSGFTSAGVEASLPTIDELTLDGVRFSEAMTRICYEMGGRWYWNAKDLHCWVTADTGVEQPDALTDATYLVGTLQVTRDYSQVVTRQTVEGMATTLLAPTHAGDTTVALADGYEFQSSNGQAVIHGESPCRVPYTAMRRLVTEPGQTEGVTHPAGCFRVGVYTTSGLPSSGWCKMSTGQLVHYLGISTTDVALKLRGAVDIASIEKSGSDCIVTTVTPWSGTHAFSAPAAPLWVTFYGTGEPLFDGATYYCASIDTYRLQFTPGGTPANVYQGYCGRSGTQPISGMTWSADVATAFASYGHGYVPGDWIEIVGHSSTNFNGYHQITATSGGYFSFPLRGYQVPGSGGTHHYAGVPQASFGPGAIPLTLCDSLTGCSGVTASASGTSVGLVAIAEDTTAQAALAAATGGTGIRYGTPIVDSSLTLAEATSRAQAELSVGKDPERRVGYVTTDVKSRAGTTVSVDVYSASYAAAVLADSPVGYWPLSETSGTVADDASTGAHDLTYYGSPTLGADGALACGDGAMGCDGVNDYAGLAHKFIGGADCVDAFSIEAWVYSTATGLVIVSQGNSGSSNTKCQLFIGAGGYTLRLTNDAGTSYDLAETGKNRGDSTLHHVVVTRGAVYGGYHETKMYVDSALTAADVVATPGTTTLNDFAIARRSGASPGSYLSGRVQHVALYTSALSATRVGLHYAARLMPPRLTADFMIQNVRFSDFFRGPYIPPNIQVQASDKRFTATSIWRRLQRTA